MIRFFIKDGEVVGSASHVFGLDMDGVGNGFQGGFDSFIDKETDHIRWRMEDGKLVEISIEEAMAAVEN